MISRRAMMNDKIVSASGTSLILESVKGSKIPSFAIKGWTKQETTTGVQLFDASRLPTKSENGVTLTNNGDGSFTVSGNGNIIDKNFQLKYDYTHEETVKLLKPGQYSISQSTVHPYYSALLVVNNNQVGEINSRNKKVIDWTDYLADESAFLRISFYGIKDQAIRSKTVYPFLAKSDTQVTEDEWEPYTGGKPSPSPDYPQEVVSAGEYNEDTQKWEYEIEVGGGNLFNVSGIDSINGIVNNGDGTISITTPSGSSAVSTGKTLSELCPGITPGIYFLQAESTGKDKYIYLGKIWHFGTSMELTEDDLGVPVNLYASGIDTNATVSDIMLNIGSAPLPYEPYKFPQSVTLTSDRPFTKWDRLEKRDGVWGWVYKSKQFVLNGNETVYDDWVPSMVVNISNKDDYVASNESHYCTHFSEVNTSNTMGSGISVRVDNYPDLQTAESFKAFLTKEAEQGTPVTIWAETIKETFVPLPEPEQTALNALHTYTPTTVITNDQQCEMQITYREWRR